MEEGGDKHKLYFNVRDKDTFGSDDIGDTKIDFKSVFSGTPIDTWVDLPAKLGLTSHGELHVYIQFMPQWSLIKHSYNCNNNGCFLIFSLCVDYSWHTSICMLCKAF